MNVARAAASAAILISLTIDLAAAKSATVAAEVNLRKGPGTDSEIITLIPKGTMVEVGTCANGWCKVSFDGQDGYSIATNLGLAGRRARRRRQISRSQRTVEPRHPGRPMGPEQARRAATTGAADRRVPGHLRGQPEGGRLRQRGLQRPLALLSGRHAPDDAGL